MTDTPRTEFALAAGVVALTTAACLPLRGRVNPTDVAMLFLLAVVFVAARYHRGPAVFASVLAIASFDLLFVPPYYHFSVHDTSYLLTFGVMLAVALVMSRLVAQIRDQSDDASDRERRTAAMYALSTELADAADRGQVLRIAEAHMERSGVGRATILLVDDPVAPGGALHLPTTGI